MKKRSGRKAGGKKGAETLDEFIYGETHNDAGFIVHDTCLRAGRTPEQVILDNREILESLRLNHPDVFYPDSTPEALIEDYEESKAEWLAILGPYIAERILKRDSAFFRGIADIIDKHYPNGGKWPAVDLVRAELRCLIAKNPRRKFTYQKLEDALSPMARSACSRDTLRRAVKELGMQISPGKAGRPRRAK